MIRHRAHLLGLVLGLFVLSLYFQVAAFHFENLEPHVPETGEVVQLATTTEEVKEIEWTRDRIIEEIRATFPEAPERAVAIAKCESGLVPDIQSRHQLSYGQERSFGLMQIHAPDWHAKAMKLGYVNYQTEVEDNLRMARYIYEQAGGFSPWTCHRMI